jgi:hypothetical protein
MNFSKLISFSLLGLLTISCATKEEKQVAALTQRIVPEYADRFKFIQLKSCDTTDLFILKSSGNKIVISGNNANSMAVGLNYYLTDYCKTNVSWYVSEPTVMPDTLPLVKGEVKVKAKVRNRFFLNYCTFGYTMPWWKWKDWERLIDWMALNGVNMPLAITGQEAVWEKVWQKYGMTEDQIRTYFTGPAHLPWHRMSNIDRWQGPLPQGWIDSQAELQKKILKRERDLNMHPVLPAFSGHVPAEIKDKFPKAAITEISCWGGFPKENNCYFLASTDSLYERIQRDFLSEQEEMFGTDHIYGMDLFNEVEPPTWNPEILENIAKTAYNSLKNVDKDAIWMQMGWLFYHDRKHWTPEIIKAYMNGVPKGKLVMLDYYTDNVEIWKNTKGFYGQPYIHCYLGNFGGNTLLQGDVRKTDEKIDNVIKNGGKNLYGIGSTLEGFGSNRFIFEFVFRKAWNMDNTYSEHLDKMADAIVGKTDTNSRKIWRTLCDSIYVTCSKSSGPITNIRPRIQGVHPDARLAEINYNTELLARLWKELVYTQSNRTSYESYVISIGAEVLSNRFSVLKDEFASYIKSNDVSNMKIVEKKMMDVLDAMDSLTGCDPMQSADKWITDAMDFAENKGERAYYAKNAATMISYWGGWLALTDYANRSWSGLISSYYKVRWERLLTGIINSMEKGEKFDLEKYDTEIRKFELSWADNYVPKEYPHVMKNPIETAKKIIVNLDL